MEQKFKPRLILRILSSISAIAFVVIVLSSFSQITKGGPFRHFESLFKLFISDSVWTFLDNPVFSIILMLVAIIGILYISLSSNLNEYTIGNGGFIIREFLKGERRYELNQINRITEKSYKLFAYLEISIRGEKKPVMIGIDKIDKFIEIMLTMQSKHRKIIYDEKNKVINFS